MEVRAWREACRISCAALVATALRRAERIADTDDALGPAPPPLPPMPPRRFESSACNVRTSISSTRPWPRSCATVGHSAAAGSQR